MQFLLALFCFAAASILPFVQAVNMTFYDPQCEVDPGFGVFYEQWALPRFVIEQSS